MPEASGQSLCWRRYLLSAGTLHFVMPGKYEAIIPSWIPEHPLMVQLSGAAEIVGRDRAFVSINSPGRRLGLDRFAGRRFSGEHRDAASGSCGRESAVVWRIALWMRLPLQGVLIWWIGGRTSCALRSGSRKEAPPSTSARDEAGDACRLKLKSLKLKAA